jgi:SAM-dependent methyltransferase
MRVDLTAAARLIELADYIVPFTVRAVCGLGIADLLIGGPLPVAELAARTGTEPPALARALRALASKAIFTETAPGVFGLTPLAQPLRSDHPLSLRDAYPLLAADIDAWGHLDHCVRTGEASFDVVHGTDYWTWMGAHPGDSAAFDASQQAASRLELRTVLPAYDWGALRTVVDVGGGSGAFLAGILARFPALRGTVFDLPHVVAGAPAVLAAAGVADRCAVVAGSFFDGVPAGADAYLLKRVLYGWDDQHALVLLGRVRDALPPGGRVLVLEPVLRPGNDDDVGKLYDLLLLTMSGTGARTGRELEGLLGRVGLRITAVVPTLMFPLVEIGRE